MASPIMQAIKQISEEKGLPAVAVLETIEAALSAAYRKDFGKKNQNVKVEFEPETGAIRVFDIKEVVSDEFVAGALKAEEEARLAAEASAGEGAKKEEEKAVRPSAPGEVVASAEPTEEVKYNPKLHLSLTEARAIKPDALISEELRIELEVPGAFGRMAAMTAKQVITQRLREAERSIIFNEYKSKEHEVLNAIVQRREGRVVLVDLGRVTGVMLPEDQMPTEEYRTGERVKVYVVSVQLTVKGPEILVSRTHPEIIRKLFTLEIPEVSSGVVVINSIAREAGARSKVAVSSLQENVDPIGASIGQRGSRIQTIIGEFGGEKVDIIEHDENAERFIRNALSPAKIVKVTLRTEEKTAMVEVAADQLSLAIGKGGQNVRLAARLTGWKINIIEAKGGGEGEVAAEAAPEEEKEKPSESVEQPSEEIMEGAEEMTEQVAEVTSEEAVVEEPPAENKE